MNKKLLDRHEEGKPIRVGIVGAGQMGKGLVSLMSRMKGITPAAVANRTLQKALDAYEIARIPREMVFEAKSVAQANEAISRGKFVVCEDMEILCGCDLIDAVVDATGNTDSGALIAVKAIQMGKHIVMLNVEADATIGHILKKEADGAGVIYTASSGDEPGAIKELYDFAESLGFEILVIGKGKNNSPDYECNPDSVREEALRRGIAPNMLTSFKDCTNTMIEMTSISNATGFRADVMGMHGVRADEKTVCDVLRLKSEGGVLNSYKAVDYVYGLDPGVFLIFTTDMPQVHHEIQYLKMGGGPNYLLYRPYHLCSLETPLTAARAVIYNEACLAMKPYPVSEAVAIAKKDLKAGQYIDGIGGYYTYATMTDHEKAMKQNLVPIGIINNKTKTARDIKKGELLRREDLIFDENSPVYKLRLKQEKIIG